MYWSGGGEKIMGVRRRMNQEGAGAYADEERNGGRRQQRYSVRAAQLLLIGLFLWSSKGLKMLGRNHAKQY
jgi:hypothetical protein